MLKMHSSEVRKMLKEKCAAHRRPLAAGPTPTAHRPPAPPPPCYAASVCRMCARPLPAPPHPTAPISC